MKIKLFLAIGLIAGCIATPAHLVHAGTRQTDVEIPELKIVAQPFNVFTTVNAQFVLSPYLNTFVAADDRLEFQLHRRVASLDSFRSIADGDVIPATIDSISFRMSHINRDYAGHLIAVVPIITTDKPGASLSIPFDGVYPLTIRIVDSQTGDVVTSVMTFLNRRDTSANIASVPFSTVIHLTSPPSLAIDGSMVITDNTRDAVTRLVTFLSTFKPKVTISIQPEIIAALAYSSLPADVDLFLSLREQLRTRSIINTTFAPSNPSLFAALNLSSEFITQLAFGESTLNRLLPGVTIQRNTWVASDNIDAGALSALRQVGIATIILLPEAQNLVKSESALSLLGRATKTGNEMISVVSPMSGVTEIAQRQPEGSQRLALRIAAEALVERDDLLALGHLPPEFTMSIVAPFYNRGESDAVAIAARVLSQSTGFVMQDHGVPNIVNLLSPAVAFQNNAIAFDTSRAGSIRVTRREINASTSMLDHNDLRRDIWPFLFSLGTSTATNAPGSYITSLRTMMRSTRDAVTVTTPRAVTLSSRTGVIRLQFRNSSTQDLTVSVRVRSAKLTLSDGDRTIVLTKEGTTELTVPVSTRSSGRIPISIWVVTPEGNETVVPLLTISANVNAIAGYGQLISITLLLVLFAWWWSNRRSARRNAANATTV